MPHETDPIAPPSQEGIGEVRVRQSGGDVVVEWDHEGGGEPHFQVYLDGRLAWSGASRTCTLPAPATPRRAALDVLAVDPREAWADRSAALPGRSDRAHLTWSGSEGAARYAVYMGAAPGSGSVSYAAPVATLPAAPLGRAPGGWGVGGFGRGGFGVGAADYSWTSPPLAGGSWSFGVAAVDAAGVAGAPAEVTVAVEAPPQAPPPVASPSSPHFGRRLRGAYTPGTRVLVLSWEASPA
jgi:hypothetical protein